MTSSDDKHSPPPSADPKSVKPKGIYAIVNGEAVKIGKLFIDSKGESWIRIDGTKAAELIGAEEINGVSLLSEEQYQAIAVADFLNTVE